MTVAREGGPGRGNTIGKSVPDGWYTRSDAAVMVGKTVRTLARWMEEDLCHPSSSMQAGQLTIWLYNDEDIARLQSLIANKEGKAS